MCKNKNKSKQSSTGKPLATQTMLIRAQANDASDLTDNARLVTAKTFGPLFSRRIFEKNLTKQTQHKRLGARACSCWSCPARHVTKVRGGRGGLCGHSDTKPICASCLIHSTCCLAPEPIIHTGKSNKPCLTSDIVNMLMEREINHGGQPGRLTCTLQAPYRSRVRCCSLADI